MAGWMAILCGLLAAAGTHLLLRPARSHRALGIIVLVRVILSFSLDIEVDGMFPWRRAETEALLHAQIADD